MKINIVSNDKRYLYVNESLLQKGCDSFICTPWSLDKCDVLILSLRDEYTHSELENIFKIVDKSVVDYGHDERFVQKNAELTAHATLTYLHNLTEDTVDGKNIFVSGYGRIGKVLSCLLKHMGANVSVFARRDAVKKEIEEAGFKCTDIDGCVNSQIIINTVPSIIFSKELTDKISKEAYLVELASKPYGFEDLDRISIASALPGKILSKGAAKAVFDTIYTTLSSMGKVNL